MIEVSFKIVAFHDEYGRIEFRFASFDKYQIALLYAKHACMGFVDHFKANYGIVFSLSDYEEFRYTRIYRHEGF